MDNFLIVDKSVDFVDIKNKRLIEKNQPALPDENVSYQKFLQNFDFNRIYVIKKSNVKNHPRTNFLHLVHTLLIV